MVHFIISSNVPEYKCVRAVHFTLHLVTLCSSFFFPYPCTDIRQKLCFQDHRLALSALMHVCKFRRWGSVMWTKKFRHIFPFPRALSIENLLVPCFQDFHNLLFYFFFLFFLPKPFGLSTSIYQHLLICTVDHIIVRNCKKYSKNQKLSSEDNIYLIKGDHHEQIDTHYISVNFVFICHSDTILSSDFNSSGFWNTNFYKLIKPNNWTYSM